METPQPAAAAINIQVQYGDMAPRYLQVSKDGSSLFFTETAANATRFEPHPDGDGGTMYEYEGKFLNVANNKQLRMTHIKASWVETPPLPPGAPRYLQDSGNKEAVGVYIFSGQPDWSLAYGVAPQPEPTAAPKDGPARLPVALIET